ncbi:type I polyketide synthase [Streptomyces varsoviensis]|nr:type I polyketide synthase [Streptomyces varsoviensis]
MTTTADPISSDEHADAGGRLTEADDTHIAVVGMACRFPGATTPEEYWHNVVNGVDGVRALTDAELEEWGEDPERAKDPRYVRRHGVVEGIGDFDAEFFGITGRDADLLNPQHRIFLECAWEALERAGYDPRAVPGTTGLFAGAGRNGYASVVRSRPDRFPGVDDLALSLANDPEHLCTRVSYLLGLTGPSVAVMTACSTSLVAVHEASRALLAGECDTALAGGVTLRAPLLGYPHREGGTLSPDGYCRTFSADARGIVGGDGAGIVVLRRLRDAIEDGDHVHAVLRGSAVNNDGRERAGYTAPGVRGQAEVIRRAHIAADVYPRDISYVEAHGTGTPVGDPIEVTALTEAFRDGYAEDETAADGTVGLGSVKTNIGHTDTAAGVASLIKTVLALEERTLPATLHFTAPNPAIDFDATSFSVTTRTRKWETTRLPRRAGVSSFGIGGTNAHVVLEEAPVPAAAPQLAASTAQLLVLSARTPTALDAMAERLAEHLRRRPDLPPAAVARTLQTGRHAFEHRRYVVCSDHAEAIEALSAPAVRAVGSVRADGAAGGFGAVDGSGSSGPAGPAGGRLESPIVFSLPGGGARYVHDTHPVYATSPAFRNAVDACCQALPAGLGTDVRRLLTPRTDTGADAAPSPELDRAAGFTVAYALARTLMDWGVAPATVTGHGVGAPAAAAVAGALPLADALAIAAASGRGEAALREAVQSARWQTSTTGWTHSASGLPVTSREAADPGFWAGLLDGSAVPAAPGGDGRHLAEIGPEQPGGDVLAALLDTVGRAWAGGAAVAWDRLHDGTDRSRVPLPTYPFERRTHLVRPIPAVSAAQAVPAGSGEAGDPAAPAAERAGDEPVDVDAALLTLFRQVLGIEEDVADPDFFEHGGDSLAAVELVSLIENTFGVALPLEDVFETPTPGGLARAVEELLAAADASARADGGGAAGGLA